MDALHPDGRVRVRRGPDHRQRRRLLPDGRERQAVSGRARRPLLRQSRLRLRRGDRPGGARADARAAVLHELVVRAPARDRARRRDRLARARRPEPRLLRVGRLGGGRVGLEARAPVLPGARRQGGLLGPDAPRRARRHAAAAQVQGDRPADRLPRDDDGRALDQRHPGAEGDVRATRARGAAREEHEPLPPAARGDRGGVHGDAAGGSRGRDPRDGARDDLPRPHGAGPERGWRLHAAGGLLARRPRALRPLRHPPLGRRGDHRLRPGRSLVRVGALRHPAGHHLLRQGPLVRVRGDRRGDRVRQGGGARSSRARRCTRTGSRSAAIRSCPRSR